jgi:hypothetical protein
VKHLVFAVVAAALVACEPAYLNGVPNENSPYFEVPVDSTLILLRAVSVPPGADGAYFQRGKAVPWSQVNIHGTYCFLKIGTRRDVAQTVEPDQFAIKKVTQERRFFLGRTSPEYRITTPAVRLVGDFDSHDSGGYEILVAGLSLQSARQPDVTQLGCGDWGIPQGDHPITVRKIRQTLGDWFELKIVPSRP